jgi:hypothetical protein
MYYRRPVKGTRSAAGFQLLHVRWIDPAGSQTVANPEAAYRKTINPSITFFGYWPHRL